MNKPTAHSSLAQWLEYFERPHTNQIKLGVARVRALAQTLSIDKPQCRVITVTGTNGKGSCVAMLEAVYTQAGYQVGAYSSPHLIDFNERIRLNRQQVLDAQLCEAFSIIDAARAQTFITYFEWVTLAALWIFNQAQLDVMILEVGIGGRLDVTNIIDADMAIIASIGIDHTEYLGTTREAIATEKAGIMRANKPVICGDCQPPQAIITIASQLNAPLSICGRDYHYTVHPQGYEFSNAEVSFSYPQLPYLNINNVATIIQALLQFQSCLAVPPDLFLQCITHVQLPGRFQIIPGLFQTILDVAHNPHAAMALATRLLPLVRNGKPVHALFSMLNDKDIQGSVAPLRKLITQWHIAPLKNNRAAALAHIKQALIDNHIDVYREYPSIEIAYAAISKALRSGDTLLVFGSFYTVAATISCMSQ